MAERRIDQRFQLLDPVKWDGEDVKYLELERPNVKMIRRNGFPITPGSQLPDPDSVSKYMADMAGVALEMIDFVSARDFMRFGEVLVSFFTNAESQGNQ